MKIHLLALLFLLSPLTLFGSPKTLRIGGIFDLTADGKVWGEAERKGMLLAIENFKKEHPEVTVEYEIEDSAYSNVKSVTAFQRLTSVKKINAIIGPTWESFLAVMPLCERENILCLAPSYNDPVMEGSQYSFGLWYDNRGYATALLDPLKKVNGPIGIIAANSPYYNLLVDVLEKSLTDKELIVEKVELQEQNFQSVLYKVLEKKPKGLVILLLGTGPFQSMLKALQVQKVSVPLFSDDTPLFLRPKPSHVGEITVSEPVIDAVGTESYNKIFQKRYGSLPESPSSAVSYDATMLLLRCMIQHTQNAEVARCIKGTEGYKGFSGAITFKDHSVVLGREFEAKMVH